MVFYLEYNFFNQSRFINYPALYPGIFWCGVLLSDFLCLTAGAPAYSLKMRHKYLLISIF